MAKSRKSGSFEARAKELGYTRKQAANLAARLKREGYKDLSAWHASRANALFRSRYVRERSKVVSPETAKREALQNPGVSTWHAQRENKRKREISSVNELLRLLGNAKVTRTEEYASSVTY